MPTNCKPRATFAIISHPDAGKTTLTEKLLLFGGAIQMAGTVKGRKSSRHATSDWMALEKQRGISVTTSVMQFPYGERMLNLLDTPGHADFSEDTYRTLTAVDSALMVIDAAKGVEQRTIKLMQICRMRTTPIFTFVNKLDRETQDPISLLDEIESVLKIECAPITWPIGCGRGFKGIYHLLDDKIILYTPTQTTGSIPKWDTLEGLDNPALDAKIGAELAAQFREEVALVKGATHRFEPDKLHSGEQTPVFFGTAFHNFGIEPLLDTFATHAPIPASRKTHTRILEANEKAFSGFVFKIQANMDPKHRDRIAFLRICSGQYEKGMRLLHVRTNKKVQLSNALTFMAGERAITDTAYPGDIIGIHNHGGIQIGDTYTTGESLQFLGIPYFAPELFQAVRPLDPLKMKALTKGLLELSEEGATQVFRPMNDNRIILGAVGVLQFDVVAHRLQTEYNVECLYTPIEVATARWVECDDPKALAAFKAKQSSQLALDGANQLTYLAPTRVNLSLVQERFPELCFRETREHHTADTHG